MSVCHKVWTLKEIKVPKENLTTVSRESAISYLKSHHKMKPDILKQFTNYYETREHFILTLKKWHNMNMK